jgi:hypothetical protein
MGQAHDRYRLADYYLNAAGIAAIWIDPDGSIGAQDVARLYLENDRIGYCCLRGAHFVLAYRLQCWLQEQGERAAPAIASRLEKLAIEGGVGLTKHEIAATRALHAVATVEQMMDAMKQNGELREMNSAFKEARSADPKLRYANFISAKKAALLHALAQPSSPLSAIQRITRIQREETRQSCTAFPCIQGLFRWLRRVRR